MLEHEKKQVKLILIVVFYLTQYILNIMISSCNQYKVLMGYFIPFFLSSLKSSLCFILVAHLNLDYTAPGLSSYMWLVAAIMDSVDLEMFLEDPSKLHFITLKIIIIIGY